jgi:hypothetical protein
MARLTLRAQRTIHLKTGMSLPDPAGDKSTLANEWNFV